MSCLVYNLRILLNFSRLIFDTIKIIKKIVFSFGIKSMYTVNVYPVYKNVGPTSITKPIAALLHTRLEVGAKSTNDI